MANTHAKTHDQYALEVVDIFEVDREGERARFDTQRRVTNRKYPSIPHILDSILRIYSFIPISLSL